MSPNWETWSFGQASDHTNHQIQKANATGKTTGCGFGFPTPSRDSCSCVPLSQGKAFGSYHPANKSGA